MIKFGIQYMNCALEIVFRAYNSPKVEERPKIHSLNVMKHRELRHTYKPMAQDFLKNKQAELKLS